MLLRQVKSSKIGFKPTHFLGSYVFGEVFIQATRRLQRRLV